MANIKHFQTRAAADRFASGLPECETQSMHEGKTVLHYPKNGIIVFRFNADGSVTVTDTRKHR